MVLVKRHPPAIIIVTAQTRATPPQHASACMRLAKGGASPDRRVKLVRPPTSAGAPRKVGDTRLTSARRSDEARRITVGYRQALFATRHAANRLFARARRCGLVSSHGSGGCT
jgi:hypothetical protein